MKDCKNLNLMYRDLERIFRENGISSPALDAKLLIADTFSIDETCIFIEKYIYVTKSQIEKLEERTRARIGGKSIGRIFGRREFWGLDIKINNETLEPRPDTEILVESVLKSLGVENHIDLSLNILDIGTGSGAILIALLSELKKAKGVGTDISFQALSQAQYNVSYIGVSERSQFVCCSVADALDEKFDIIVSNPPYIPTGEIASLAPEVKNSDPILALDGGQDGLGVIRKLCSELGKKLKHRGKIFLEIGYNQSRTVLNLLNNAGFIDLHVIQDLSGHDRVVTATLK